LKRGREISNVGRIDWEVKLGLALITGHRTKQTGVRRLKKA